MKSVFARSFEYQDGGWYFTAWGGQACPLQPGEDRRICSELRPVLGLVVFGLGLWGVYSLFVTVHSLSVSPATIPAWLVDRALIYPAEVTYWILTWGFSLYTWLRIRLRLAGRERLPAIAGDTADRAGFGRRPRGSLIDLTKPLQVGAIALIITAFVAQGFGDVCVLYRGIGHCEIVTIGLS